MADKASPGGMTEPPHPQGAPLWLTAYHVFEGHAYGEAADRVIRKSWRRSPEEASHVRLRFFAPGSVLEETIWPHVAEAAASRCSFDRIYSIPRWFLALR